MVPKELDQAINAGKRVLPFCIDDYPLREDFGFYLSNVQRYEAWKDTEYAAQAMIRDIYGAPSTETNLLVTDSNSSKEDADGKNLVEGGASDSSSVKVASEAVVEGDKPEGIGLHCPIIRRVEFIFYTDDMPTRRSSSASL